MNSEELKKQLRDAMSEIASVKHVARRLDEALDALYGEDKPQNYRSLVDRLNAVDTILWNIHFADLTGLDKLLWPKPTIEEAKEWYNNNPYIERSESDDSYSTWSWKAQWDDLKVLEQDKVIQQYVHNQREENATA